MTLSLHWVNCLWLMLPLLAWNIILGPRIKDVRITSDSASPKWLLLAESISRILVFALPLFLDLLLTDVTSKAGLWVYILGTLIYFATWLPFLFAPRSAWCNSTAGLLAPRITPLLPFIGVSLIGHFWPYGVIAFVFILLHTWHGIQNILRLDDAKIIPTI